MSEANKAMDTLTDQWYNAVVAGLGLSDKQFQLYQGPNSLMSTSQSMWNMFNAVPPNAINANYLDPAQANNFAPNFNEILVSLVPNSSSAFKACMGDYYKSWQDYFDKNDPETYDAEGITALFNKWAIKKAPGKAGCVTALTNIYINPVNSAIQMFAAAKGSFAWNKTIEDLQLSLAGGATKSFSMDSLTESKSTKHTWASGRTSVLFNIFSFGAGGSYDRLSSEATSEGLTISANYNKVTTFAAGPYAQKDDNDPILSDYQPWYYSAALAKAYTKKDNTVWDKQAATTWDTAFGEDGFLQRMCSALVVVDGVEITMTSTAKFSAADREEIRTAASGGFWPFFSASSEGGSTTEVTFNEAGQFTSTTKIASGNPQIIGILQSSMENIFG